MEAILKKFGVVWIDRLILILAINIDCHVSVSAFHLLHSSPDRIALGLLLIQFQVGYRMVLFRYKLKWLHGTNKCRKLSLFSSWQINFKVKAENRQKKKTRHVFVEHGCPRRQQSQDMAKFSKSYILTLSHPHGHVMSVKCEEPTDELTVQVWLLYHHPNFKYCTLWAGRNYGQTDGRSDY